MLQRIRQFFEQRIEGESTSEEERLKLATAALFVEMTRQDETVREVERSGVVESLQSKFGLPRDEAEELMVLAESEASDATDYHQFTSLINRAFSPGQKIRVIESLWRIAAADGEIDTYEEHMVRKISELLYVPHGAFINAKLRALGEA